MANAINPIPEGMHSITPHLVVKGASEYIDFLKSAFGAVEILRAPAPDGKLVHATVRIGDSMLALADHLPDLGAPPIAEGFWPLVLHLYVPDADTTFAQATAVGCQVIMPLTDQFWGDRYGQVQDPFGFRWAIATRKENVGYEEMMRRQDALFGKAQPA